MTKPAAPAPETLDGDEQSLEDAAEDVWQTEETA
jgi:hypothetical protein